MLYVLLYYVLKWIITDNRTQINKEGIFEMLKLESPNLHEIGLDRVIAYGHT